MEQEYVHKKSIFGYPSTQRLQINTALNQVARNLANVISPSQSKPKSYYQQQLNTAGKPIIAQSHPQRIRHSIAGKVGFGRNKITEIKRTKTKETYL